MKATCTKCKRTFNSGAFQFGQLAPGSHVIMRGNRVSCIYPGCDGFADLEDAEIKVTRDGVVKVLTGLALSDEKLFAFKALAEKAQEEKYSPDQFKAATASIGIPDNVFTRLVIPTNPGEFWTFIGVLIAGIGLYLHIKSQAAASKKKKKKKLTDQPKKKKKKQKKNTDLEKLEARRIANKFKRDQQ